MPSTRSPIVLFFQIDKLSCQSCDEDDQKTALRAQQQRGFEIGHKWMTIWYAP
ncbi:hypothetical protein FHW72_002534 [Ochrobactrum sp. RC6B]|nr:hypothetical protein [Ochrobactrum sp. RC6B]